MIYLWPKFQILPTKNLENFRLEVATSTICTTCLYGVFDKPRLSHLVISMSHPRVLKMKKIEKKSCNDSILAIWIYRHVGSRAYVAIACCTCNIHAIQTGKNIRALQIVAKHCLPALFPRICRPFLAFLAHWKFGVATF